MLSNLTPDGANICFLKVDDFDQSLHIIMTAEYSWLEDRIKIDSDKRSKGISLNGYFVSNCLWDPGMQYLLAQSYDDQTMVADANKGPVKRYTLFNSGKIRVRMVGKLSTCCVMDFSSFPFDKQVEYSVSEVIKVEKHVRLLDLLRPSVANKPRAEENQRQRAVDLWQRIPERFAV